MSAAVVVGMLSAVTPAAWAGSRDVEGCTDKYLNPIQHCTNPNGYHSFYVQAESWNSNGAGLGSCAGVSNQGGEAVYGAHCTSSLSSEGYDESYCTAKCYALAGYGWLEDNSSISSYFTVWIEWA